MKSIYCQTHITSGILSVFVEASVWSFKLSSSGRGAALGSVVDPPDGDAPREGGAAPPLLAQEETRRLEAAVRIVHLIEVAGMISFEISAFLY